MLQGAGAGLVLTATGARPGWSATTMTIGSMELTTLSDGYMVQPKSFVLADLPQADYMPVLERYAQSPDQFTPECNVTLLRDGDRVILFDAGSGSSFLPTVGKLAEAMDTIGLAPEDVTHVIFTHTHADHLWGVLDDFDDPLFVNAEHMIGKAEFDFWIDPRAVDIVGPTRASMAVGAQRRLQMLGDSLSVFNDGDEVLPGIAARMTPGHTPGHMSFEVRVGSAAVMIAGDAFTNHHLNFERPDLLSPVDQDGPLAAQTRLNLLDQLVQDQMPVIGFHLPGGGFGRVERQSDAYRFVPADG